MENEIAACKVMGSEVFVYNAKGKCIYILPLLPGETFQGWTSTTFSKRNSCGQIYIYDCNGRCISIC